MRLLAFSILGLTFEVRLGEHPSSPSDEPPSPLAVDGTLHESSPPGSFPLGFSLPSTSDPREGWAEE